MTSFYDFLQDLKFSLRQLAKAKIVTTVLLATIALAIAVNAIAFGTVDSFFHPLRVRDADQIVVLTASTKGDEMLSNYRLSYPALQDFRNGAPVLSDVFGFNLMVGGLSTGGKATQFLSSAVTGNYFSAMGVTPALGRLFEPGEGESTGAPLNIVLGYSFWQRQFNADPRVIGRQVRIDGKGATVIGVVSKDFHGLAFGLDMDGYLPLRALADDAHDLFASRGIRQLTVVGRLGPGIGLRQAQTSMNVLAERLERDHPATDKGIGIRVTPEPLTRPIPLPAMTVVLPLIRIVLLLLAGLVLLLAGMNVANILLVRATVRGREMAIRAALGSGRGRLIRQMLTESLLLALLGAAAGIALGKWVATSFTNSLEISPNFPIFVDTTSDGRVITYSIAIAILTGLLTGIWPALRASQITPGAGFRDDIGSGVKFGRQRMRSLLIVGQVAGSLVLLITAGLFVRGLRTAQTLDLGFKSDHVLNARLNPEWAGYSEQRTKDFYRELERRVKSWPEVRAASEGFSVPFGPYNAAMPVFIEGRPAATGEQQPAVSCNFVDDGYFDTMQIPILRGRAFEESDIDTAPRVAVVNQTMAARYWPNENPIGKRFHTESQNSPLWEVVGLAHDSKYVAVFEKPQPHFYLPLAQSYQAMRVLQIRSGVAPESLRARVEQEVRAIDPDIPVVDLQSMQQALESFQGYMIFRIGAAQAGVLGVLGLILAIVGVYGVVSYGAAQRTREIGIRMALGATPSAILALILHRGVWLVILGVSAGLVAALGLSHLLSGLILLVSATDPVTFVAVPIVLAFIALWACFIPAYRAMRVDPIAALRHD